MATDPVSTAALDHFQRIGLVPSLSGSGTGAPLSGRRAVRVMAIGQPPEVDPPPTHDGMPVEPLTLALLVGLAASRSPIAYLVEGRSGEVAIRLGTWSANPVDETALDAQQATLLALLEGGYPAVDVVPAGVATPRLGHGALALGIPSAPIIDARDGAAPVDRLVRTMTGLRWAALILATPLSTPDIAADRNQVINEMRAVATAVQASGSRSPLAEHYLVLLQGKLDALADAHARGGWRTGVYLMGESALDLAALTSAWRAVFSTGKSMPEPVHTLAHGEAVSLAAGWALPEDAQPPGPGGYRHPFAAQTVMSSAQLAAYVHLPSLETAGFGVRRVPRFDALPPGAAPPSITVGAVIERDRPRGAVFSVPLDSLSRHALVAGVTGSGKSNSVVHLLRQASAAGVPFLVIEPAKTEYRALLQDRALTGQLRVFTLGRETVSPLRLNPFDVPEGIAVAEHIDLLRTVFTGAFGMWEPLPHVLERCIHEVYADRGWDLRTNQNHRLRDETPSWTAYPTLTELGAKISHVSRSLGYEDKVAADIEAALTTRLQSLRIGGKGALLDVARSLPMDELLSAPTVLELEGMGSDDDKAFVMGLLLVRLVETRRAQGQHSGLKHLFVVEEAHRLLGAQVRGHSDGTADPRGNAVETFANLLSEIRAYGQGVIVADQVPTRLAPDVMKNTQLKLAHRTVAADDRAALASSMGMNESQSGGLVALEVGRAAVFGYGADAPVLVQVPGAKDDALVQGTGDATVRAVMTRWRSAGRWDELWLASPACTPTCAPDLDACSAARALLDDVAVQRAATRLVLSLVDDATSLGRTWPDLIQLTRSRRSPHLAEDSLLRSLCAHLPDWYAARRGAQAGWAYAATTGYADRLRHALLARTDGPAVAEFRRYAVALQVISIPPYPGCFAACADHVCRYRGAVADAVASGRYDALWAQADAADRSEADHEATWRVGQTAAHELMELAPDQAEPELVSSIGESRRRVALCFSQQMLAADSAELPEAVRRTTSELIAEHPGPN